MIEIEQKMESAEYGQGYRHGWDAAVRLAAQIAEHRHKHWASTKGRGGVGGVTACEEIAAAIRGLEE